MTTSEHIEEAIKAGAERERKRIVGLLLAEVGTLRASGEREAAEYLDALALVIEHTTEPADV